MEGRSIFRILIHLFLDPINNFKLEEDQVLHLLVSMNSSISEFFLRQDLEYFYIIFTFDS